MSVLLRKRKNKDGSTSLYLDIYHKGERKYEFLSHLKLSKPSSPADRVANKENLELAERIAIKRAQELTASDYVMVTDIGKKTDVVQWMQGYIETYRKKDKRNLQGALNRFRDFLIEEKKQGLTFGRLDELIVSDFQEYLRERSTGEGASSYFNRFKKMVKQAFRQKLMLANPAAEVKTRQGTAKRRDVLTLEELQLLASTPCQSEQVKRAALFSAVTGLRWADISTITWASIDLKNRILIKEQTKVEGNSKTVSINLNDTAIAVLGESKEPTEKVFKLPTANGANKTVSAWVKRAGINKKITWHCWRHSFGTLLVFHGADVTSVANLLGHSTLKYTQRYVKTANELKEKATDKLNINLS